MICIPCKGAGQLNRLANDTPAGEIRTHYWAMAEEAHSKCQYPSTCPCHHRVGPFLATVPDSA